MAERRLFDDGELADSVGLVPPAAEEGRGTPRLRVACRDQVVMRMLSLDQVTHSVREERCSGTQEFACLVKHSPC